MKIPFFSKKKYEPKDPLVPSYDKELLERATTYYGVEDIVILTYLHKYAYIPDPYTYSNDSRYANMKERIATIVRQLKVEKLAYTIKSNKIKK